jgi:hypothetical protein
MPVKQNENNMIDRDSNGKFLKGNKAAVNRKSRGFNQIFQETLTDKDFTCILKKVIKSAKGNNLKAQLFLLKMCLPRLYEITQVQTDPKPLNPEEQRQLMISRFGPDYRRKLEDIARAGLLN